MEEIYKRTNVQGSALTVVGDLRGCCAAATWEGELSIKYYCKKLDLNRKKEKINQGNGLRTSQTQA